MIQELVQEERCTRNSIVGHSLAYIELLLARLRESAHRVFSSPPLCLRHCPVTQPPGPLRCLSLYAGVGCNLRPSSTVPAA